MIEDEFLLERFNATKALIVKYETAIDAISTGAQSYSLDTGQTRQVVTQAQLGSLQLTLQRLWTQYSNLRQQLYGTQTYVRPGW